MNTSPAGAPHGLGLDWQKIDTVLLDMDGTLLDLNYDNCVWNDLFPKAYAELHNQTLEQATSLLLAHMREIRGTIEFYSFDYWIGFTGIDLEAIHREPARLIRYRPGAREFLTWLRNSGRRSIIATNAHRSSVAIKDEFSNICETVDTVVSSHDCGHPKESPAFWEALATDGFCTNPNNTLFIDDNEDVLDAAAHAGIRYTLCVSTPDSNRPARSGLRYPSFDHFEAVAP